MLLLWPWMDPPAGAAGASGAGPGPARGDGDDDEERSYDEDDFEDDEEPDDHGEDQQALWDGDDGEEDEDLFDDDDEDGHGGGAAGPPDAASSPPDAPRDPVRDRGVKEHGCEHYRRRAKIVAPCCDKPFWCRHCHNAVCNDGEPDPAKRHVLDRKAVREVVCALCGLRQDKACACKGCGVSLGRYVCLLCSFYDDDLTKECFHCQDCGICRVGGASNFFHCTTCNCCYALSLRDQHVCIENSMKQNCPVCMEYLFDSIRPINIMPQCGHTIHQDCLRSLAENNTYTCPLCMKSIMAPSAMTRVWDSLDQQVQATPMPQEYASLRVAILCNDCQGRSSALFHVLGHKCQACGSYNTRRV